VSISGQKKIPQIQIPLCESLLQHDGRDMMNRIIDSKINKKIPKLGQFLSVILCGLEGASSKGLGRVVENKRIKDCEGFGHRLYQDVGVNMLIFYQYNEI